MKLLLRQNVDKLGHVGDIVNVRPGYARNYLLPHGLAMAPTEANLKVIEADKQAYLEQLAKERADLEARAKLLEGKEVTIFARANEEGHLYGSVGPAQIAAALDSEGISIEIENVVLDEPIHNLDKYEVQIRFSEDVTANIGVWVVPPRDSEQDQSDSDEKTDQSAEDEVDPNPSSFQENTD